MTSKILKGKAEFFEVDQGIGEYFFERTDFFGNRTFQIDANTGEEQSFLEVRKRSVKVAIELQKLGVKPKDLILICCNNDLDSIVPWFAGVFLDAIVCVIDSAQDVSVTNSTIALTKPKVVFVIDSVLDTIQKGLDLAEHNAKIIVLGISDKHKQLTEILQTEYEREKVLKPVKVNVKKTAFIFFTSATTAAPKGIEMNHYGFMHYVANIPLPDLDRNQIYPEIQRTGLNWVVGVWHTVLTCAKGTPKLLVTDLSPQKTLEYLSTYKIENFDTGAHGIIQILEGNPNNGFDFSNLKSIVLIGIKIHKDTILTMRKLFPKVNVFNCYGSSEMGTVTSFDNVMNDSKSYEKVDSIGVPVNNVEIKIVDVETRLSLEANQEGEIMVKTPFGMNGYYKSIEPLPFDEEGFYKSQDLGYYDEDGYFYIVDRLSNSFKIRINNTPYVVHPSVIEERFLKHPNVREISVFNLPSLVSVNDVAALVVLKDYSKDYLTDILDFVNEKLHKSHKVTGGLKVVKELPKNLREKVPKRMCRELFLSLP